MRSQIQSSPLGWCLFTSHFGRQRTEFHMMSIMELSLLTMFGLLLIGNAWASTYIKPKTVRAFFTTPDQIVQQELSPQGFSSSRRGLIGGRQPARSRNTFKKLNQRGNVAKWSQTIDGLPVYGSVLTTRNDKRGKITRIQGFLGSKNSLIDTTPKFTDADALAALKSYWNHDRLRDVDWRVDPAELQILQSDTGFDKLVWKLSYYVDWKDGVRERPGYGPLPSYIIGLVNAHTRLVERSWNNLQHADTQTSTITAVVGNTRIGKEYHDIEVERRGWYCWHKNIDKRVEVFDIWNKRYLSNKTRSHFVCPRAGNETWDIGHWTGGYSPRNEAYIYAGYFVDMWREFMGDDIQPYKTDDSYLQLYTHYGYQYENAFFNGFSFVFGDGKDEFYPLTALDVVCHEIAHAITEWHGGFMEYWLESGAMNEAYSDIVGETCDIHFKQKNDYVLAADILKPGNTLNGAMRDMCDPRRLGGIDHYNQYTDDLEVHKTSGIYNKAWCLLVNTPGWTYIKAFEIFTDANLFYWTPMITMHCGACGVETATADRGYSKADVTAAFNLVGVSCLSCT